MPRQPDPRNLERVLQAAVDLFYEEGFDGASMQDLATRVGLHKSSLYHYVGSKEELFARITGAAMDGLEASMTQAEAMGVDEEPVLRALGLAVEQAIADMRRVALVLRQKSGTPGGDVLTERRRAYDRRFAALVERGQDRGDIRTDIPPVLLTRLLLSMANWLVEWYEPGQSRYTPQEIQAAVLALARSGIRGG